MGIALSVSYLAALLLCQWSSYLEAGLDPPLLFSASLIALIFVVLARSPYGAEARYFKASQENIENQRQLIELNIEFTNRLRAFLPKRISQRLFAYIEQRRMTVLQAIEEVLRPKPKVITCLFSDIRGFTKQTQSQSSFVDEGVIPNVRRCTRAVEDHGGIPRKIGDLIFAYFDDPEFETNVRRSLCAAVALVEANAAHNVSNSTVQITRNVLVASGQAIVGNLGGFDSSIEITALGNPVNLLSRIDEAVKQPRIRDLLAPSDIVLDEQTASALRRLGTAPPELRAIDLFDLQVAIRDFEDIRTIWILPADSATKQFLGNSNDAPIGGTIDHVFGTGSTLQTTGA
jgi:class 3 adenylate cyclase